MRLAQSPWGWKFSSTSLPGPESGQQLSSGPPIMDPTSAGGMRPSVHCYLGKLVWDQNHRGHLEDLLFPLIYGSTSTLLLYEIPKGC